MKQDTNNEKRNKLIFVSLIILLTIIAFSNSLFNELISYDDPGYIIENELIRGLSFHNLRLIFSSFVMGNYHPFVVLSDAVIYHFFKLNPLPYHAFSLLVHILNVVLVFNLTFLLLSNNSAKLLTTYNLRLTTASIVAFLFAIHPMHCETVCWSSDLKDLLFTFFYLASMIYYIKYIRHKTQDTSISTNQKSKLRTTNFEQRTPNKSISTFPYFHIYKFYIISFLLFVCSCFSKSAAVTLPIVLILLDYLMNRKISKGIKGWRLVVKDKIPFFLLSLLFGVINIYSQASNIYTQSSSESYFDISKYNIADRIIFPIYNLAYYTISSVIPYKLSVIHPYPEKINDHLPPEYYIYPVIFFIIILAIIRVLKSKKSKVISQNPEQQTTNYEQRRYLIFGILFFIINLALVLQIIPVGTSIISERYTYLSYFGLFFIIGQFYLRLLTKDLRLRINITAIVIILIFSFISHKRNHVWADNLSLFNDVIEKYPESYIAYEKRGLAKYNLQDFQGAIQDYNKAIEINPNLTEAYNNRGNASASLGDYRSALQDINKAIGINPGITEAYNNRGIAKYNLGDKNGAIEDFNKALVLNPQSLQAFNNRGNAKYFLGDMQGAIEDFNKVIKLDPQIAGAYYNRANAKYNIRDKEGACSDWKKASELGYTKAYDMLEKYCK